MLTFSLSLSFVHVQQFEVKDWPEEDYGEFYNGDSYIILSVSIITMV